MYGGAHRFRADLCDKLARLALQALEQAPPDELSELVRQKLAREPIEDYRIDFEDGYGRHDDAEEDAHAREAAEQLRAAERLPRSLGLRIKSLGSAPERALRTLELFLGGLEGFSREVVVTAPKVESVVEVEQLVARLDLLEARFGLPRCPLELMVESPAGLRALPHWLAAAQGRLRGVHLGPFDFLASCGVLGEDFRSPLLDAARAQLQFALAGTGVWVADGPTTLLPLAGAVQRAWEQHAGDIRHAQRFGIFQTWDLHPAQLVSRYRTVYAYYREAWPPLRERLRHYREQATHLGGQFDDAATVRSLVAFARRGADCGALPRDEVEPLLTGLV